MQGLNRRQGDGMNIKQLKGILNFHKRAYRAYKGLGNMVQARHARRHMIDLYLQLRKMRINDKAS